jgi:signal transduction histidine kinase
MRRWRRWPGRHQRVRDTVPAAVLLACQAGAVTLDHGWGSWKAGEMGLMAVSCVPLAWRSRRPLAAVVATLAAGLASMVIAPTYVLAPAACVVALYSLAASDASHAPAPRDPRAARARHRVAWTVGLAAGAAITATYALVHSGAQVLGLPFIYLDCAILATGYGIATRDRRLRLADAEARAERAERSREAESRRRVAEERLRIARDLHDVVAHHITLVNAQAGVAHHLMSSDPDTALEVLGQVKDSSRAALDELRATVGYLRQPGDLASRAPLPSVGEVGELVGTFRNGGMMVELERRGPVRAATSSVEVAAYRIIQEALTNAHKHAAAASVRVTLEYLADRLRITVADDGRPAAAGYGSGHGLIGMRERAAAVGGAVSAGPRPEGGFRVLAELPLGPCVMGTV